MTDLGFEIKTDLALKQYSLNIPFSAAKGNQMLKKDVHEIYDIANVGTFAE